jgi:hypothetical protein
VVFYVGSAVGILAGPAGPHRRGQDRVRNPTGMFPLPSPVLRVDRDAEPLSAIDGYGSIGFNVDNSAFAVI